MFEKFINAHPYFILDNELRHAWGLLFEKYIKKLFIDDKQKTLCMDTGILWNVSKSFQSGFTEKNVRDKFEILLCKKEDLKIYDQFALFPSEQNLPLFDFIIIHQSQKLAYFVSIKIKKPNSITKKQDLKFLLKPLNKNYQKDITEEEKKKIDDKRKNSVTLKLEEYCAAIKEYFGTKLNVFFKLVKYEFLGGDYIIKVVTITDYDCRDEIEHYFKDSVISEIISKGLSVEKEQCANFFMVLSYERMREKNLF